MAASLRCPPPHRSCLSTQALSTGLCLALSCRGASSLTAIFGWVPGRRGHGCSALPGALPVVRSVAGLCPGDKILCGESVSGVASLGRWNKGAHGGDGHCLLPGSPGLVPRLQLKDPKLTRYLLQAGPLKVPGVDEWTEGEAGDLSCLQAAPGPVLGLHSWSGASHRKDEWRIARTVTSPLCSSEPLTSML